MNDSVKQPDNRPKRSPYTPWIMVTAFAAPVVLAYALYFSGVSPPSLNNNGELIQPVIDVETLALTNENNEILERLDITEHKWHMIYFAGPTCDGACNMLLLKLRQINIAAGKNAYRLRRLIVHLEPADAKFNELINREYPETKHAKADRNTILSALRALKPDLSANEVYLMDPLGNIMMRYTQDQSPKDILSDLKKLFKVSQIG